MSRRTNAIAAVILIAVSGFGGYRLGTRHERNANAFYNPQVFAAYHRGLEDGVAIWKPNWEQLAVAYKQLRASCKGSDHAD